MTKLPKNPRLIARAMGFAFSTAMGVFLLLVPIFGTLSVGSGLDWHVADIERIEGIQYEPRVDVSPVTQAIVPWNVLRWEPLEFHTYHSPRLAAIVHAAFSRAHLIMALAAVLGIVLVVRDYRRAMNGVPSRTKRLRLIRKWRRLRLRSDFDLAKATQDKIREMVWNDPSRGTTEHGNADWAWPEEILIAGLLPDDYDLENGFGRTERDLRIVQRQRADDLKAGRPA